MLCQNCFSKITFIDAPYCRKCGKPFTNGISHNFLCTSCNNNGREFSLARSLFLYDTYISRTIVHIKQTGDRNLIKKCCTMIVSRYKSVFDKVDVIIPVPSYWSRTLIRGFNPPDVIALEFSKLTKIPVNRFLKRTLPTQYQHKKTKNERIKNVSGAFSWRGNIFNCALLVDDVFTTGATLNECARTLKNSGIPEVRCITIASTEGR